MISHPQDQKKRLETGPSSINPNTQRDSAFAQGGAQGGARPKQFTISKRGFSASAQGGASVRSEPHSATFPQDISTKPEVVYPHVDTTPPPTKATLSRKRGIDSTQLLPSQPLPTTSAPKKVPEQGNSLV